MPAALDALVIALYVQIDDFLGPRHQGRGRPPKLTDSELITLAVAQVLLGVPNDRQFLALARWRLSHLFPQLIDQSGYNRRLRGLAPEIGRAISYLAWTSPSFDDQLRLLDSTPVPCGQSRETAKRSEFAGSAGYGYCRSHSRWFWGYRLYLITAGDGMPIILLTDKGFAGQEFEALVNRCGGQLLRPDRKDEPHRHGHLGRIRQWIESTIWTCKGQLGLERHGARTLPGLAARIGLRLLTLAAGIWHNHQTGQPPRAFAAYGR